MLSAADYLQRVARAKACANRGAWTEAATVWEQVVNANPVNGDHWHRLADARFRRGDYPGAIAAFRKVMSLGVSATREEIVAPGEISYRLACCFARMGDTERALITLGEAKESGYRDLEHALVDEHLRALHNDSRLHELVGTCGATELSRDDGWRLDARLLAREIRRRPPVWPGKPADESPAALAGLIKAIPQLTDAQIVVELSKMVASLGDGHAIIEVPERNIEVSRLLPVQFYLFEEGLFVIAATARYRRLLGARVDAFDGRGHAEVLVALDPLLSRDNEYGARERALQVLRRLPVLHALGLVSEPGMVTLSVQALDQDVTDVQITAEPGRWSLRNDLPAPPGWEFFPDTLSEPLPLYLRNCGVSYWFEHLPEDRLVYFQFNGVSDDVDEPLAAFSERLFEFIETHNADRLVIDMRWNNGGNLLLVTPLLHGLIRCRRVNRYGGLFVIIGRRTFSAAQYTATAIEANTHAIFVGEPTGSRPNFCGESAPFVLPYSGIKANISDEYWQNDLPLDQRQWIAPELYTPPTFSAFRSGRDPAMEAILGCRGHLPGS
jgi:tetratricopeptide (TPR) repeat protein